VQSVDEIQFPNELPKLIFKNFPPEFLQAKHFEGLFASTHFPYLQLGSQEAHVLLLISFTEFL